MNLKLELKKSKEDFEKMCSERDIWKKDAKQIKKENSELFEFGSRKEKRVKELEKIIDLKNDQKENSVYARKNNIENLLISSMIVRSRARTNLKMQFLSYFSNCNFSYFIELSIRKSKHFLASCFRNCASILPNQKKNYRKLSLKQNYEQDFLRFPQIFVNVHVCKNLRALRP